MAIALERRPEARLELRPLRVETADHVRAGVESDDGDIVVEALNRGREVVIRKFVQPDEELEQYLVTNERNRGMGRP